MGNEVSITCLGNGAGAFFVDGGRRGYRDRGIPSGGPADIVSARQANYLLGQAPDHPCLEVTLNGGKWRLEGKAQIVVTGADMNWYLDGQYLLRDQVIEVKGEQVLQSGFAQNGCRAYLAVRGEWDLPKVLGSVEKGLPGTATIGRNFRWMVENQSHDDLPEGPPESPDHSKPVSLKAVPGPEFELLSREQQKWLASQLFTVGKDSDRQGLRLENKQWQRFTTPALLSSPVLPGTVQVTPSGPILLGPDAQTIGGYPRIWIVVSDLSRAFQLRPGEQVRFRVDP